MPTVAQVFQLSRFTELPEYISAREYIEQNCSSLLKIDEENFSVNANLSEFDIKPEIVDCASRLILQNIFLQKEKIQYSTTKFSEECENCLQIAFLFNKTLDLRAFNWKDPKHKDALIFFKDEFERLVLNTEQQWPKMPASHCLLLSLANYWTSIFPIDQLLKIEDFEIISHAHKKFKANIWDLKSIVPFIHDSFTALLNNEKKLKLTNHKRRFSVGNLTLWGEFEILLGDWAITDYSAEDMKISIESLLYLLLSSFLNDKANDLNSHHYTIQNFAFINWRLDYCHTITYEIPGELNTLFKKLNIAAIDLIDQISEEQKNK